MIRHFSYKFIVFYFCFQDSELTWSDEDPDFTFCFKQSVLVWVPCGFLWLYAFIDIRRRRKSRYSDIPWSLLNVAKFLTLFLLISLTITDFWLMISVRSEEEVFGVQFVSSRVKIATFVSNFFSQLITKKLIQLNFRFLQLPFIFITRKRATERQYSSSCFGLC